jgi:hypothetical protein
MHKVLGVQSAPASTDLFFSGLNLPGAPALHHRILLSLFRRALNRTAGAGSRECLLTARRPTRHFLAIIQPIFLSPLSRCLDFQRIGLVKHQWVAWR